MVSEVYLVASSKTRAFVPTEWLPLPPYRSVVVYDAMAAELPLDVEGMRDICCFLSLLCFMFIGEVLEAESSVVIRSPVCTYAFGL